MAQFKNMLTLALITGCPYLCERSVCSNDTSVLSSENCDHQALSKNLGQNKIALHLRSDNELVTIDTSRVPQLGLKPSKLYKCSSILRESYWMFKHEVSQELYASVMGHNPSKILGLGHPVENISWFDALRFCETLTALEHKAGRLPLGYVYRLPSSLEWEFAATGGLLSEQHPYAGGSKIEDVAWIQDNSQQTHHPVGVKKANELGLYDMTGNVWEWCIDQLPADKTAKPGQDTRIKRGGAYYSDSKTALVTNLGEMSPHSKGPRFGFRPILARPYQSE